MSRKYVYKPVLVSMLITCMVFLLCACEGNGNSGSGGEFLPDFEDPNSVGSPISSSDFEKLGALEAFEYNYGSFHGGAYEFTILNINATEGENLEPAYRFIAEGFNGVDMYANADIEKEVLDDIKAILMDQNVRVWNGFSKRDQNILDGYGFGLTATFSNGVLSASGYEKYPKNYEEGHAALSTYLEALADRLKNQEIRETDDVVGLHANFYEEAGRYELSIYRFDANDSRHRELAAFSIEQYSQFRNEDEPAYGNSEFCSIRLEVLPDGKEPARDCVFYINKAQYPDDYTAILKKCLAADGKPEDYLASEEFETAIYKEKFIYPTAFLYDKGGLGTVIVDMPEQTITWNKDVYTVSQQDMLEFYEFSQMMPPYELDVRKDMLYGTYLEDGKTATGEFEAFIFDGNTWLVGNNHKRDMFSLYGNKGGKPEGWDIVTAKFESLIKKADKE